MKFSKSSVCFTLTGQPHFQCSVGTCSWRLCTRPPRVRLDPTHGRCFWQEHLWGNCLCVILKSWELLKSEMTLLLFQALRAWDGAGVQRVRTQLWDHVLLPSFVRLSAWADSALDEHVHGPLAAAPPLGEDLSPPALRGCDSVPLAQGTFGGRQGLGEPARSVHALSALRPPWGCSHGGRHSWWHSCCRALVSSDHSNRFNCLQWRSHQGETGYKV